MHEWQLMAQVVKMVEDTLHQSPHSKPSIVRLKVSTRSHVFEHDEAARIGEVSGCESSIVVLKTVLGTHRILDLLSGEQLPRIC